MSEDDDQSAPEEIDRAIVEENWEREYKRSRGIFTDTDRRFLWGLKEYKNKETSINRRKEIRSRAVNGIQDLSYLTMLEDRDRDRVFEALNSQSESIETHSQSVNSVVSSFIEFIYLGIEEDKDRLEKALAQGIRNAEFTPSCSDLMHQGALMEVSVDIDIDRGYDAEAIQERYERGEGHQLTPAEIGVLVREGFLEPDDLEELKYERNSR